MRFRILGPLEVFDGTHWRGISAAKPRTLLATLLVQRDVPVPADRLGAELWGEREPKAATNLIQQYVMRLRRELDDRQGRLLVTRPPGYQMVLADEGDVDAAAFTRLGDSGRAALAVGDVERAAGLLAQALALWRGPALADVPTGPLVEAEAARLAEQRLDVLQSRVEADLACGRHAALVPELRQSVREHPLREGLWGQLMLALYRSGRQAEALDAYREVHRLLAGELSIEPSAPLCDLQLRMLRGDPRLDLPEPEPEPEVEAEAEAETGTANRPERGARRRPRPDSRPSEGAAQDGQPTTAPRQLPAAVGGFAGRRAELRLLDGLPGDASAGPGPAVCVIAGTAGAGKTTLALHWAHRAAPHFPDGQLYVNLHGFAPPPDRCRPARRSAASWRRCRWRRSGSRTRWRRGRRCCAPRPPVAACCSYSTTPPTPPRSARCCRAAPAAPWSSPAAASWPVSPSPTAPCCSPSTCCPGRRRANCWPPGSVRTGWPRSRSR
ncbi:BTAD domain-containing putative transcriptional regulator [Streptomyces sp. NPDC005989]|uniref:AfsR/SARP family transcriptional regulator n=1 Tax=Streptomyces sp. NPDC005989 TaxID=3156727 RepID=UPI0034116F19